MTRSDLTLLEKFERKLLTYVNVINDTVRIKNHLDNFTDEDSSLIIKKEIKLRKKLNVLYGEVETIIVHVLGSVPYIEIPMLPGQKWNVFLEALSNGTSSNKGTCLQFALQTMSVVIGKAKRLSTHPPNKKDQQIVFDEDFIKKIVSSKVKVLCIEFNQIYGNNPNATALLFRTILLIALQLKLGSNAKEDLGPVLSQAIGQNIYEDRQIRKILEQFQKMPKIMLDATHHSQWIVIEQIDMLAQSRNVPFSAK